MSAPTAAPPRMPPLPLLRSFEAAARHLSFKQAAAELCVTPAAVSQQIKALEQHLGRPLFRRLTRALALTEAGRTLLPGVRQGLDALAAAVQGLQPATAPVLALHAPPSLAQHWLLPRLAALEARLPGVEIRLTGSADAVEAAGGAAVLAALAPPPGDGAWHLAIVYGPGRFAAGACTAHPDLVVDALLTPIHLPVCTPALAARLGAGAAGPRALLDEVLLHDDTVRPDPAGPPWGWPQWLADAGLADAPRRPGRRFSNAVLAIAAARAGQGVALAARPMVADDLARGSLVAPFERALPAPFRYWLVRRRDSADQPAVAECCRWLQAQAQTAAEARPSDPDHRGAAAAGLPGTAAPRPPPPGALPP